MDQRGELFFAGDHSLEGLFEESERGASWGGVVVAHPHPLYGGTMAQPVVYRVAKTCREQGLATLRFNFRGVGASTGSYSGRDEYLDVQAALAYLQQRLGAARGGVAEILRDSAAGPVRTDLPIGLVGYSFGSVMAASALGGPVPVDALALIAFPLAWKAQQPEAFARLAAYRGPVLAVCGEEDEIAPPGLVEEALTEMGVGHRLEVLPGAGHLFEEARREVGRLVAEFMAEALGRRAAVVAAPGGPEAAGGSLPG
jgi:alpha/beta superfamily hydrolase